MALYQEIFEPPEPGLKHSPSSERPIDLVHLARQTLGDKDTETQVLCLFARQARQCFNQLCGTNHLTKRADLVAVAAGRRRSIRALPRARTSGPGPGGRTRR